MICALLLGRDGSVGFPGKNTYPVLGQPLVAYPLRSALRCNEIDRVYVSTNSPKIKTIGRRMGARIIDRPARLATRKALGEDAYRHGYNAILQDLDNAKENLEMILLLFANAPMSSPKLLSEGIRALRKNPKLDSAISVSRYNMWSPLRARKIGTDGLLHPFVPFETFGNPATLNCDRDSQGDVWFADFGVCIVRPRCIENMNTGILPQRWMGKKIYPLKQEGGLDVDYPWQMPQVEFWIKNKGKVTA